MYFCKVYFCEAYPVYASSQQVYLQYPPFNVNCFSCETRITFWIFWSKISTFAELWSKQLLIRVLEGRAWIALLNWEIMGETANSCCRIFRWQNWDSTSIFKVNWLSVTSLPSNLKCWKHFNIFIKIQSRSEIHLTPFRWNLVNRENYVLMKNQLEIHLQVSQEKKNDPDDFWACAYDYHNKNHDNLLTLNIYICAL